MRETTLQDYKARMVRVLLHIQQHLDEETPLAELAQVAAFSPYHFHRMFRGMVGESVKEHIRRLRLERAATRLKLGRRSVTDIAFEAGYGSHEAFTRAFKAMWGTSPSAFRSRNGADETMIEGPGRAPGVHYREGENLDDFEPEISGGLTMDVKIENLDPIRVAFVRHTGPYNECGKAWEKLCTHLGKDGLLGPGVRFFGLCYDDPDVTPQDKIRYDACAEVDEDFEPQGEVGAQTIEGGEYALTTHFGPYDQLSETYARLYGQWLPQSGREARSAPSLESYLNDPENTEPDDLVTDIYAPLEPR